MFANKHAKILIALVCAVLGFMLATQFKTTERQKTINIQRAEDLSDRLKAVEKERDELSKEMEKLHGKGIKLVLDDSKIASKPGENPNLYIIHDDDLLRVINELRAAGAEAIAINGERIVAMSEIRCAGPTLSVNNNRSAPPYEIKAIGNPNNLESALKLRGGVLENFKFWGIQADLSQSDDIVIPAFKGRKSFEYAKIAEGQASDAEKEAAEK